MWVFGIKLVCGKHLHHHIISLREEVLVHKTSLTTPLLLKCLYQARKVKGHVHVYTMNQYVLQVSILSRFYNFSIIFCNCSDSVACLFLYFRYFITDNSVENLLEAVNQSKEWLPTLQNNQNSKIPWNSPDENLEHWAKDWELRFKFSMHRYDISVLSMDVMKHKQYIAIETDQAST